MPCLLCKYYVKTGSFITEHPSAQNNDDAILLYVLTLLRWDCLSRVTGDTWNTEDSHKAPYKQQAPFVSRCLCALQHTPQGSPNQ